MALTDTERRNLQTLCFRFEFDGLAYHHFMTTPWHSPLLISDALIEEARRGGSIISFHAPDRLTVRAENGEATYRLVEHDALYGQWEARLVESWMDPEVYVRWLSDTGKR